MLFELLFVGVLVRTPQPCASHAPPIRAAPAQDDHKAEFEKLRQEAEGSVEKLWKLHEWCTSKSLDKEARSVLRAILKIDDGDRKAHELLGEVEYDGKWFASDKKVEEYKKKKLEDEAKKSGKAIFKGELVDPADVPFLERGMKKLDDGRWVDAEEHKRISEGWVQQDLEWVPPAEIPNIAKGLWKCGEQWLTEAEADKYHAEYDKCWKLPSAHFVLYSTCSRATSKLALAEAEQAYKAVNRVFGRVPQGPVMVLLLNTLEQYNRFANGELGGRTELTGFSSLHGGFFAEIWVVPLQQGMTSGGVAFWDVNDKTQKEWAPMHVRYAAAHALTEALDPSPKALAALASDKPGADPVSAFWKEKLLPAWVRYGAAAYADGMFLDTGKDPERLRKFSIGFYIANRGGIDPLDKIFAHELTLEDVPGSEKLIFEAGLVVAFVLDGKCPPVIEKHAALKDAFKHGKDVKKAAQALEEAIRKNEAALRKFAGL